MDTKDLLLLTAVGGIAFVIYRQQQAEKQRQAELAALRQQIAASKKRRKPKSIIEYVIEGAGTILRSVT